MARFYQADKVNFQDYIDLPELTATGGDFGRSSATGQKMPMLSPDEVLPEDRPRLFEVMGEYDQKINEFATALQQNPDSTPLLTPQIRELGSRMKRDYAAGELAAMRDRYKKRKTQEEYLDAALKNDPQLLQLAKSQIKVEPLNWNSETGEFGDVKAPAVSSPFTNEDMQKWLKSAESLLEQEILENVKDKSVLDNYTDVWELGEVVGVTRDKAVKTLAGLVTPEMIRSLQQKRDFLGQDLDESNFYDAKTGRLNLQTTMGQTIASAAGGLTRTERKTQWMKDEDEGKLEGLKRGTLKFAKGLEVADEAEWLAKKVTAMYEGRDEAYTGSPNILKKDVRGKQEIGPVGPEGNVPVGDYKVDNFLELAPIAKQAGVDIINVRKRKGNAPLVTYSREEVDYQASQEQGKTVKVPKTYTVPLNNAFLRDILPSKIFSAYMGKMQEYGQLNEANEVATDYSKDVGAPETKDEPKPKGGKTPVDKRADTKVPGTKNR